MLRLDRYITRRFLLGILPAMLLLLALFSFMALAEELEDVGQGSFTIPDALMVVFLTTPKRVTELLPVTALLGGLLGLGAMANNRELIIMRAAGISKQRIARTIALLSLALCLLVSILQFTVIPAFEREAADLRGQALQEPPGGADEHGAFWTRNDRHFVRVDGVQSDRMLTGLEIHTTDEQGRLTTLTQAAAAFYDDTRDWLLTGVVETRFEDGKILETYRQRAHWPELLSAEQAATLILPLEALSPDDLLRTIASLRRNQVDTHQYEVVFWHKASLLPSLVAMALLSLPFLLGSVRSVSAGQRVMIGGLIGITFYLAQQLAGHLAGILGLNPALVVMAPPCILLAIAIGAIRHRNL